MIGVNKPLKKQTKRCYVDMYVTYYHTRHVAPHKRACFTLAARWSVGEREKGEGVGGGALGGLMLGIHVPPGTCIEPVNMSQSRIKE